MMIPYIEILEWQSDSLKPSFVIEPSQFWAELSFWETGEFEIYAVATKENLRLAKWQMVKIPNKPYLWVITKVTYEYNADGARMVSASGFEAKWICSRRIIQDPIYLKADLKSALSAIFEFNLGDSADPDRRIGGLTWELGGGDKSVNLQATRGNLYEYVMGLLKTYQMGATSLIDEVGRVVFKTIEGEDKSGSMLFSQSMDNLLSAVYSTDDTDKATDAQIVNTFSEKDFVAYAGDDGSGLERAEITISPNLSLKVKDEGGAEITLDPASQEFGIMQESEGIKALAERQSAVSFEATIDLRHSRFEFGVDFFLGDIVRVRDEYFGYEAQARITKYTIRQDSGGYSEEAEYGSI